MHRGINSSIPFSSFISKFTIFWITSWQMHCYLSLSLNFLSSQNRFLVAESSHCVNREEGWWDSQEERVFVFHLVRLEIWFSLYLMDFQGVELQSSDVIARSENTIICKQYNTRYSLYVWEHFCITVVCHVCVSL